MSVVALAALGAFGLAMYMQKPRIQVQKCAAKKCPPRAFPMTPLGKKDLTMYVNEIPEAMTVRYDLPAYTPNSKTFLGRVGGYLGKGNPTGAWSFKNQDPMKTLPAVYDHHQSLLETNANSDPGVRLVYSHIVDP